MAHYEPPHQDLRCLQIQLFSSLVVKELSLLVSNAIQSRMFERGRLKYAKGIERCALNQNGQNQIKIIKKIFHCKHVVPLTKKR